MATEAQRKATKRYYEKHKEEILAKDRIENMTPEQAEAHRAKQRAYYQKRKDEGRVPEFVYSHDYYVANKDRMMEQQRKSNLKHADKRRAYQIKYHEENRDEILRKQKLYRDREDVKIQKRIYQAEWYAKHPGYRAQKNREAKERKALAEEGKPLE